MTITAARPAAEAPPPQHRRRTVPVAVLVVTALTLLGAWLRRAELAPSSLWLDDAAPALSARAESLHEVLVTGMTAPGFALALRGVFEVAGFGALTAQALPWALGVLGAPLAWWAGRRAGLRSGALVAAAVVLTAPMHLTYSTRVKPYTLDLVLCLLLLAAAFVVLRDPRRGRPWLVLGGVAAVAPFLSFNVAPTVVAAFAATLLAALQVRTLPREAIAAVGGAGAAGLAVFGLLVRPASTPGLEDIWSPFFLPRSSAWPVEFWERLTRVADGLLPLPDALGAALLLAVAVAVVVRQGWVVGVLLLGPLAVTAVLATAQVMPLGGGRTDIQLYAGLALAAGVALDGAGLRSLAVPAVVTAVLVALAPPPAPYPVQDVRPLVELLERERQDDDGVLVYSATRWAYGIYTAGPVEVVQTSTQANNFAPVPTDPRVHVLDAHRADPQGQRPDVTGFACDYARVWLLVSHATADVEVARQTLGELGFAPVRQDDRPGAVLQLWERDSAGC